MSSETSKELEELNQLYENLLIEQGKQEQNYNEAKESYDNAVEKKRLAQQAVNDHSAVLKTLSDELHAAEGEEERMKLLKELNSHTPRMNYLDDTHDAAFTVVLEAQRQMEIAGMLVTDVGERLNEVEGLMKLIVESK